MVETALFGAEWLSTPLMAGVSERLDRKRQTGTLSTPIDGVGHVLLTLNRELFSGIGGGNNGVVIQHELGHCLGLRHSHGGIMRRSITIEPTIITQKNREDAAALRLAGVVGVDSLVGN